MLASFWSELSEATREVITGLGGFAAGVAVLVFLSKTLLKQLFEKDLEAHKSKLEVEVAKAKNDIEAQSNRQLETLKSELSRNHDTAVEQFKSRLQVAANERQTVFDSLHKERAAAIADVYTKLIKAVDAVNRLRILGGADIPAGRAVQDEVNAFYQAFDVKRLYFTEEISPAILEIEHLMGQLVDVYMTQLAPGHTDQQLQEMQRLRNMVSDVRLPLEREFRRLLGVVQQHPVAQAPAQAPRAQG